MSYAYIINNHLLVSTFRFLINFSKINLTIGIFSTFVHNNITNQSGKKYNTLYGIFFSLLWSLQKQLAFIKKSFQNDLNYSFYPFVSCGDINDVLFSQTPFRQKNVYVLWFERYEFSGFFSLLELPSGSNSDLW